MNRDRAQVREQMQTLAQREQSLFGTNPGLRIGPLRSAHGAEQHRVSRAAGGQRLCRQRALHRVDSSAADEVFSENEVVTEARGDCLQRANAFARYFRTDAVAAEDDDRCFDTHALRYRLCVSLLVTLDGAGLLQQEAQLVDAVQQAVAREPLDRELHCSTVGQCDRARLQIDLQ